MTKATLIVGFVRNRLKQSWLLDMYREREIVKRVSRVWWWRPKTKTMDISFITCQLAGTNAAKLFRWRSVFKRPVPGTLQQYFDELTVVVVKWSACSPSTNLVIRVRTPFLLPNRYCLKGTKWKQKEYGIGLLLKKDFVAWELRLLKFFVKCFYLLIMSKICTINIQNIHTIKIQLHK